MAMVLPCSYSIESYVAAGKNIEVPRPDCPSCWAPMVFWNGYWRSVRACAAFHKIWIRRARCSRCATSHGLLPSFLLLGRYDPAEVVGSVLKAVATGESGVRPTAERVKVPYTTARDWVRRFSARAGELAVAFGALALELGAVLAEVTAEARRDAVVAIEEAFKAACDLPGWLTIGCWGFCSCVLGGKLVAPNTDLPAIFIGKRRFIAPVP